MAIICIICLFSCTKEETKDVWDNALYTENTEIGKGEKSFSFEVKANDRTVKFTVKTDKDTVGDALIENNLISGDEGQYGLYVKVVNGITADYDVNKCYWAFYVNDAYAMSGVDNTKITESDTYQFVYTKE